MSDDRKGGGPAFPMPVGFAPGMLSGGGTYNDAQAGMTLRDWFAGLILNGLLSGRFQIGSNPQALAYEIADKMLAERSKTQGG